MPPLTSFSSESMCNEGVLVSIQELRKIVKTGRESINMKQVHLLIKIIAFTFPLWRIGQGSPILLCSEKY